MDNLAYQSELMQLIVLAMREKDNGNLNDVEIARIIDLWKMALTPTRTKTFQYPTTVHFLKKSFSPHPPQLRHPRSPPLPLLSLTDGSSEPDRRNPLPLCRAVACRSATTI